MWVGTQVGRGICLWLLCACLCVHACMFSNILPTDSCMSGPCMSGAYAHTPRPLPQVSLPYLTQAAPMSVQPLAHICGKGEWV